MEKRLLTQSAAIQFLGVSRKIFLIEVTRGNIPRKSYGNSYRYRKEDLKTWQKITEIHSPLPCADISGMRTSHHALTDGGLSFAKVRAVRPKKMQQIGA